MSNAATARAIAAGELRVAHRHVEQGAVRLDVLDRHALGGGDAGDRGDLVEHEVFGFLRRDVQLAPAEADEIGKPRMRADRDAVRLREPNRVAQHRRIAGVKSRGDVGRGDRAEQAGVVADGVGAERLAGVGVDVDAHKVACVG